MFWPDQHDQRRRSVLERVSRVVLFGLRANAGRRLRCGAACLLSRWDCGLKSLPPSFWRGPADSNRWRSAALLHRWLSRSTLTGHRARRRPSHPTMPWRVLAGSVGRRQGRRTVADSRSKPVKARRSFRRKGSLLVTRGWGRGTVQRRCRRSCRMNRHRRAARGDHGDEPKMASNGFDSRHLHCRKALTSRRAASFVRFFA